MSQKYLVHTEIILIMTGGVIPKGETIEVQDVYSDGTADFIVEKAPYERISLYEKVSLSSVLFCATEVPDLLILKESNHEKR